MNPSQLVFIFCTVFALSTPAAVPDIKFKFAPWIDRWICPSEARHSIPESAWEEAEIKLPLFESKWEAHSAELLAASEKITGIPFSYSQKTVRLFLCPALPGWGLPTVIPLTPFLLSFYSDASVEGFTEVVWHELLHAYIVKAIGYFRFLTNPLMKKYSTESIHVRFHLHLFALQKAVLLSLNLPLEWETFVEANHRFGGPYIRAAEIVQKEGYEKFIQELRGTCSSRLSNITSN